MRRTIPVLVVVGLAVVVALLLINRDGDAPSDTLADATTTTTSVVTTTVPGPTTTTTGTSTTAANEVEVVETVEEAEAILRELWFGWFEGIYNEDEDRIREVVVLEETVEQARESFGVMDFSTRPEQSALVLSETELLRSDSECIAIWAHMDVEAFRPDAVGTAGVNILRKVAGTWKLLSVWPNRGDLWEADCESVLSP